MELQLKIIGILLVALSFVHAIFPKYFNWKEELKDLSIMNREMMKVHTFFIAFVVFGIGLLNIFCTSDLMHTSLGKKLSIFLGMFWGIRSIIQFFGYSSKIWKGKIFETVVHVVFSIFWIYMTVVYFRVGGVI